MSGKGEDIPGEGQATGWTPDMENHSLANYLLFITAVVSAIVIVWRVTMVVTSYVRTVAGLNNDTQRYFARASGKFSWVKKHILYAPLLRKRHNREFQLSSAINVGTLPSRFQFLFLLGYFTTNVVFTVLHIPFADSASDAIKQVRNRSGTLATVNMIPLFILAGRNNPLIPLLGISFDTMNLIHRWFGRIVAIEAVVHTLAFYAGSSMKKGWGAAFLGTFDAPFLLYGFIVSFTNPFILSVTLKHD